MIDVFDKKSLKQNFRDDVSSGSLRHFVVCHPFIQGLLSSDLGPRSARQSVLDYERTIERRAAVRFLNAPGSLQIRVARTGDYDWGHVSGDGKMILAILRLESGPNTSTREATVSLLVRDENHQWGGTLDIPPGVVLGNDTTLSQSAARRLLGTLIGELIRKQDKTRLRAFPAEGWQEDLFASFGFKRLQSQELLKAYPAVGHPKRAVAMRRRITLWDAVSHVILLAALVERGRAVPLISKGNTAAGHISFAHGDQPEKRLCSGSSSSSSSTEESKKRCDDFTDLACIQKIIALASQRKHNDFFTAFFVKCCRWVA